MLYFSRYPSSQDPSFLYFSSLTQHHKIPPLPNIQRPPILQTHGVRYIFSNTSNRLLNRNLRPRHEIPHTFIKTNTCPNQSVCPLDGHFIPLLQLVEWNLSMTRMDTIRQARKFYAICDEKTMTGRGSICDAYDTRMQVYRIGDDGEERW